MQHLFHWSSYLAAWMREMTKKIESQQLASDTLGAESLIQGHQSLKAEIDARKPTFDELYAFGDKLVSENHFAAAEIASKIESIKSAYSELVQTWEAFLEQFEHSRDALQYKQDVEQAERWVASQEALLASQKTGVTVIGVEENIAQLMDLEKSLAAQEFRFNSLYRLTTVIAINGTRFTL